MDYVLTITGLNSTEMTKMLLELTNTTLVFFQNLFAKEESVTLTGIDLAIFDNRYLPDTTETDISRYVADVNEVDISVRFHLKTLTTLTSIAMNSIVNDIVEFYTDDYIAELMRSVSSDISGGEFNSLSDIDNTSMSPSIILIPLIVSPSIEPTNAPSVSNRPSTTPSERPSARETVTTAQTMAAVAGGAAAAASSVSFISIYQLTDIYQFLPSSLLMPLII